MSKKFWLRTGLLIFLIILCFGLVLSFSIEKSRIQDKKPVTIKIIQDQYSLLYLPQYIALWKGFFDEEKLIVKITPVASEKVFLTALRSGRGDILLSGLEQAIYPPADQKERLVAFCALTKKEQTFLVARKQEKDFQWTDLKDKTVITGPPGSKETVIFQGILIRHGFTPNRQVTLYANIPAPLQIGAFKSGTGDYILAAGLDTAYLEKNGLGKTVASLGKEIGNLPGLVFLTSNDFLKKHPDTLQRFTNAIYKALLWLGQHEVAEICQLLEQNDQPKDEELIKMEIEKYKALDIWAESPVISRDSYEHFLEFFLDAKEIPAPVPYGQAVVNIFAEKSTAK